MKRQIKKRQRQPNNAHFLVEKIGAFRNNVVQIALDGERNVYKIEHVEYGDSVSEVLAYVQQSKDDLISEFRQSVEQAVRAGGCTLEEARHILETYRSGFEGYTYMER